MLFCRLRAKLPRLLSGLSHYGVAVGEDAAIVAPLPWSGVSSARQTLVQRHATSTNAPFGQQGSETEAELDQPPVIISTPSEEAEFRDNVLTIPDNLDVIGQLNPALREAMEAHAQSARQAPTTNLRQHLDNLLQEAHGKKVNLTKSALSKLPIDQLRSSLDMANADIRGTKAVLIARLLESVASATAAQQAAATVATLGEGLVSRGAMHRAARLAAGFPSPTNEAELRSAQNTAIEAANLFSRVFASPHDAARLLVDAHGDDIAIIDVQGKCSFTDYMVLASARSAQHAHALAASILHEVKVRCKEVAPGVRPGIEGSDDPNQDWLVVDAGSVVVHVFQEEARKEYNLEGLWGEGSNVARVAQRQQGVAKRTQTLNTIRA